MTTLLPPPTRPSDARPRRSTRRRRGRTVVAVVAGGLLLAALLNPDDLVRRAKAQPFGWQRTVTVRLAEVDHDVSAALWLDRPRRALDRLFGHEHAEEGGSPTPTPVVPTPSGTSAPSASPSPASPAAPRRPTAADPLRVYLGGDSVAEAFGEAFDRLATRMKVIKATVEYRFSTGLSRPDYYDWPARLHAVLSRTPKPEVVIVLFGANDVQPIMTPSGPARPGSPPWLAEYRRRVAATMSMLSSSGVAIYWVGQPLMRSAYFTKRIGELDAIYASEAARHANVTFIDSRPVLADAHGRYSAYLPGSDGRPVLVRAPDGVHLTEAGGDRLAAAVLKVIDARWPVQR